MATVSPSRFLGLTPAVAAGTLIAVSTLARLFFARWLPMLPDETYYLQWSRHLDASYFSKGPAVAYTIAAGTGLLGPTNLGVRFFAVLLSAGTAWQVFLLARRWYDDTTGLLAVLLIGVVPLYNIGAVVMTIDPLSAFFWVWAANLFSGAIQEERWRDWLLTGFAIGSGFLAKYLNALELVAVFFFLVLVPPRRHWLARPQFWAMLATAVFCGVPVWWWNAQHGWATVTALASRGHLEQPTDARWDLFLDFLLGQAGVISPFLFVALMIVACRSLPHLAPKRSSPAEEEGETLLLLLFFSVFLFYAALAWHVRGEPNWPAVSYLTLLILLAAWGRQLLEHGRHRGLIAAVFVLGWIESLLLYDPEILPLPGRLDPLGRVVGWSEIATHLDKLRREQQADVLIADAYKEASAFSFYLPDQAFIYTLRHQPPAQQYDFWPGYPTAPPHRALWITSQADSSALAHDFNRITVLEKVAVYFRGQPLRAYTIYRCENVDGGAGRSRVNSAP